MSAKSRSSGRKPNNKKKSASKLFDYDNDEAGPSNAVLVLDDNDNDDDDGNEMPATTTTTATASHSTRRRHSSVHTGQKTFFFKIGAFTCAIACFLSPFLPPK